MRYYSEDVVDRIIDDAIQYGIDIDAGGTEEKPSASHYPSVGSNWHTGTPTEEGWYQLCLYNSGNWYHPYFYFSDYFSIINGMPCWSNDEEWEDYKLVAWQMLEPYRD